MITSTKGTKTMISQTTKNFAAKRDINISLLEEYVGGLDHLSFDDNNDQDSDAELASYLVNHDGSFTFYYCADQSLREELPAHVRNEKHLREVIDFIATTL